MLKDNLRETFEREQEIEIELATEYTKTFHGTAREVRIAILTQEILDILRHPLDWVVNEFWLLNINDRLSSRERREANVAFPITTNRQSFSKKIRQWKFPAIVSQYSELLQFMESLQPYDDEPQNHWLKYLSKYCNMGKHMRLVIAEKKQGPKIIQYTNPSAKGNQVKSIVTVETLFLIDGHEHLDALNFCRSSSNSIQKITERFCELFL